jgi:hypothetical protein
MQSETSKRFSKLHWVFMYSIWALAELTSVAAVVYSIYSVIILLWGNLAGAAVFAGIIPGFIMSFACLYLCMLTRIPWHAGDYQLGAQHEYQVRQVRPFHTILWNKERSEALPYLDINPHSADPVGEKNGSIVYCLRGYNGFKFEGRKRWLAYAWAILCETFVLAVLLLSMWFMVWAGIEASLSFLSGTLLLSSLYGIDCSIFFRKHPQWLDRACVVGLTWVIIEERGNLHLRHFLLFCKI